jgi:hypothetical protein
MSMMLIPYVVNYRERVLKKKRLGFERKRSDVVKERDEAENSERRESIATYKWMVLFSIIKTIASLRGNWDLIFNSFETIIIMMFGIVYMYTEIPPPSKKPIVIKFFVKREEKPATIRGEDDEETGHTAPSFMEDEFSTPPSFESED